MSKVCDTEALEGLREAVVISEAVEEEEVEEEEEVPA